MKSDPGIYRLMENLGVTRDETAVYLYLLEKGPRTALELSRGTRFSRTQVYTIVEDLIAKGLVNEVLREYGRRFEATPPDNLRFLLADMEQMVESLEEALPSILDSLSLIAQEDISRSKIRFYTGVAGLRQVVWNETKAKDIFRIYEIEKIQSFLDESFAAEILREFVRNRILDRQLTNIKEYEAYTDVSEFIMNWWELRYVDPNDLKIIFETKIYNDVFCMYDFVGQDVFCVEIYNANLAEMQKQIFDFVWDHARPMKIVDPKGKAVLQNVSK